jgi:hypothetical protein
MKQDETDIDTPHQRKTRIRTPRIRTPIVYMHKRNNSVNREIKAHDETNQSNEVIPRTGKSKLAGPCREQDKFPLQKNSFAILFLSYSVTHFLILHFFSGANVPLHNEGQQWSSTPFYELSNLFIYKDLF